MGFCSAANSTFKIQHSKLQEGEPVAGVGDGGGAEGGFLAEEAFVEVGADGLVGGAEIEVCAVWEDAGDEMMEEGSEKVELAAEWRCGDVLSMGYAAGVIDTDGGGRNKGIRGIRGIRGFCARGGGEDEEADVGGEAGAEDGELGGGVDGMGVVALAETTFDYGHEGGFVAGLFDDEGDAGGGVEDAAAQLVGGERVGEGDGLADVDVGDLSSEAVEGI